MFPFEKSCCKAASGNDRILADAPDSHAARRRFYSSLIDSEPALHQPCCRFLLADKTDKSVMAFSAVRPSNTCYPFRHFANLPPDYTASASAQMANDIPWEPEIRTASGACHILMRFHCGSPNEIDRNNRQVPDLAISGFRLPSLASAATGSNTCFNLSRSSRIFIASSVVFPAGEVGKSSIMNPVHYRSAPSATCRPVVFGRCGAGQTCPEMPAPVYAGRSEKR